ncbi:helix-turn-helix domain-containing protein [Paenibacillus sp. 1011MAR3C5]|uniref:helix-turn-helix domain-containing protein n=1 Tax=Paenibacillus sp. 1011MAR3C5 TaxID=1675787 RepID=UPI0015FF5044|nr:helix-turn-helix domain-containing protein [Paenibacillus sp. 1011MAR3C5]
MAFKGQKLKQYSHEVRVEAIRLHVEEGWTYRRINVHFGIIDKDRMKIWMRKYRKLGEFGLLDRRGRKEEYIDENLHIESLKRENDMLKKCWEIWMQEERVKSTGPLNRQQDGTV